MGFLQTIALDIAASWARLLIALLISILFSIVVGIAAATNRTLERIILPILDVLQTIPILGFFPIVILLIVSAIPGYVGINTAVIFLIFTSMSWNISFGVYEAVKAIPQEMSEIASLYRFSFLERVRRIYVPSSLPRMAYQSSLSFSIGIFYLATSEIFSTGSSIFSVRNGIGVEIAGMAAQTSFSTLQYLSVIAAFVAAVILTRVLILEPFLAYSERFSLSENAGGGRQSKVLAAYIGLGSALRRIRFKVGPRIRAKAKAVPLPMPPQIRRPYRLARHRQFKHIYATIVALLAILAVALLMNASQVPTEIYVLEALGVSFLRVWGTYVVCAAIAVPLGILISRSRRMFGPIASVLQVIAAIPATILLPALIVLLAGTPYFGEGTAFAVIFISMIWYLLFSVIAGMRTVPASLVEAVRSNRLSRWQAWRALYLPAALPSFVTGSITAIGGGWNSLIIAEFFAVQSSQTAAQASACFGASVPLVGPAALSSVGCGIGKLIDLSVFSNNLGLMFLSIISMTIMVIAVNRLLWQKVYNSVITRYKLEV